MADSLIVPLTKSPHPKGRIGPTQYQDWYQGCVKAARLNRALPGSKVLILSNVQIAGAEHEVTLYTRALTELGVSPENLLTIREGYNTIDQVEVLKRLAKESSREIIVISTFLHYPRVRWVCRGLGFTHQAAFGIPRPKDALWDTFANVLFPIIDLLGGRERLHQRSVKRRKEGKL